MIINRGQIARDKISALQEGQTVFADSHDIIQRLQKAIQELDLDVVEDVTDRGTWFIPRDTRVSK